MHQPCCRGVEELDSCPGRQYATVAKLNWQQIEEAEDGNYKAAMFASLLSAVKLRVSKTIHNVNVRQNKTRATISTRTGWRNQDLMVCQNPRCQTLLSGVICHTSMIGNMSVSDADLRCACSIRLSYTPFQIYLIDNSDRKLSINP